MRYIKNEHERKAEELEGATAPVYPVKYIDPKTYMPQPTSKQKEEEKFVPPKRTSIPF